MRALRGEDGYICCSCARKNKWRWPKGHCATQHQGICPKCGSEKPLCAESDWLQNGELKLRSWD